MNSGYGRASNGLNDYSREEIERMSKEFEETAKMFSANYTDCSGNTCIKEDYNAFEQL